MFQRFAIFTIKKTMKATIMNVINATKKSPMPNDCFVTVTKYVDRLVNPGMAKPNNGIMKSLTTARTKAPKYNAKTKATAKPRTLYFDRKSLNSFHKPFGGWDGGAFSKASLIFFNSASISSSVVKPKTPNTNYSRVGILRLRLLDLPRTPGLWLPVYSHIKIYEL